MLDRIRFVAVNAFGQWCLHTGLAQAAPLAYITNAGAGNVSVLAGPHIIGPGFSLTPKECNTYTNFGVTKGFPRPHLPHRIGRQLEQEGAHATPALFFG